MRTVSASEAESVGEVRLSQLLALLHLAGVILLVFVVLISVLWVSAEHNRLGQDASKRLVAGALATHRGKVDTLVRDYSAWDEAYAAAKSFDRDWLYSNIGSSVTEVKTLDMIVFFDPATGADIGWRVDSPDAGESGLLPQEIMAAVLGPRDNGPRVRSILARLDGEIWAFSASPVTPVSGTLAESSLAEAPQQIHGLILSQARLDVMAESLLVEGGLTLAAAPAPGQVSLPLTDYAGRRLAEVVWAAPRPGARILTRITTPLSLALGFVGAIAFVGASAAVRSAQRLERALDAAREADRMKSEFLSNVTHELRTPMNGILGVAQLFEMTELDEEQRELLGVLDSSARTQMALIGDLLDFSRLEAGHRELAPEPFTPSATLDELAGMVRASLGEKPVVLETDWRGLEGLVVESDARAFRQIVTNLLGNAVKFTHQGSISARARATRAKGRAEIEVEVADTGVGIPESERARIFERFYRVDGSLTRATEGAGLGLAISQRLAGLMGGRIEVESEPGQGSTFRFKVTLPIVDGLTEARQAA